MGPMKASDGRAWKFDVSKWARRDAFACPQGEGIRGATNAGTCTTA